MTREYIPPADDEPLDDILRALVPILVKEIRAELDAERQRADASDRTARTKAG